MKKLSIRRIFSLTLLLLFLLCGSGWAANFTFTDLAGQWLTDSDVSITFDWSTGPVTITNVGEGWSPSGTGAVGVSLNTDYPWLKSYSLDATAISGGTDPVISVTDSFFPVFPFSKISANSSDDFFVAWDLKENILMLYYGDPNCYTYLGLDFSDDWSFITDGTSITFTSSSVEAIFGQQLCSVPIPGAIWLLSSGLFGLVCIRRKNKS